MAERRIIIGDPHGCLRELQALVEKVGYRQGEDALIIVGDLLDRGPYPVEVVEECMRIGAWPVRGNHEDSALRWLAYEERVRNEPGFVNPMEQDTPRKVKQPRPVEDRGRAKRQWTPEEIAAAKAAGEELARQRREARVAQGLPEVAVNKPSQRKPQVRRPIPEERKAQWRALTPAQRQYLDTPCYIDLARDWYVVHAGVEPRDFGQQNPELVMRIRYVNPTTGRMIGYEDGSMEQPEGSVWWMEAWEGPQNIIYGHAVHSLEQPRVDVRQTKNGTVRCFGIDTGCVFGGRLTAMVFDDQAMRTEPYFVQVQAERAYMEMPGGGGVPS
jgi:hypothetical protein